jgi:hypothetical protein
VDFEKRMDAGRKFVREGFSVSLNFDRISATTPAQNKKRPISLDHCAKPDISA